MQSVVTDEINNIRPYSRTCRVEELKHLDESVDPVHSARCFEIEGEIKALRWVTQELEKAKPSDF